MIDFAIGRINLVDIPVSAGRNGFIHHRHVDHERTPCLDCALQSRLEFLSRFDLHAFNAICARDCGEVGEYGLPFLRNTQPNAVP